MTNARIVITAATGGNASSGITIAGRNHVVDIISYDLIVRGCRSIGRHIEAIRVGTRYVEVLDDRIAS